MKTNLVKIFLAWTLIFSFSISLCEAEIFAAEAAESISGLVDDDMGDYTFFHSDYPIIGNIEDLNTPSYYNVTTKTTSTENYIEFGRLDKKNKDRDNSIKLHKGAVGTVSDCFVDVELKKAALYGSKRIYKYFLIEADITVPKTGVQMLIFRLRDNKLYNNGTGYSKDFQPALLERNGSLKAWDGTVWENYVAEKKGSPAHWKCLVNLENHTVELYIDNVHFGKSMKIREDFTELDMVRISMDNGDGVGDLFVREWHITGLEKPYSEGKDVMSSVFYDEAKIKQYMADKIAISTHGMTVLKNGVRSSLTDKPIQKNDDVYISVRDFEAVFGSGAYTQVINKNISTITAENGKTFVPICKAAEVGLNKYTADGGYGTVYISDKAFDPAIEADVPFYKRPYSASKIPSVTVAEELRSYVLYERPSAEEIKAKFSSKENVHPRLFVTRSQVDRLKELIASDEIVSKQYTYIMGQVGKAMGDEKLEYGFQDKYRMHDRAERFQKNMQLFGLAYLLTGDRKYVDRAWVDLSEICQFPDLNTPHIIDTGMFLTGLAVAYDWMYDAWTDDQRNKMAETAINLGIKPQRLAFYGRLQGCAAGSNDRSTQISGIFPKWASNYNTIANSGLAIAALAFMEKDREICSDALEKSIRSIEYTMKCYEGDGCWVEGPVYWGKATAALTAMLDAIEGVLGSDFGLTNAVGFDKTASYIISMQSEKGINNYHDANDMTNPAYNSQLTWLGTTYADKDIINFRRRQFKQDYYNTNSLEMLQYSKNYDMIEGMIDDNVELPKLSVAHGSVEAFSARSAYFDKNAFYVSAHGGSVGAYHSHNDAGTFVLDMIGEKWAIDLGTENYNIGISNDQIYRKKTEGHNTITINDQSGYNQTESAFVPIIDKKQGIGEAYVVYDMSDAYSDATKAYRGFFADKNMSELTVRDELVLGKQSDVCWYMHTKAAVDIDNGNNQIVLTRNEKKIYLKWTSNVDAVASCDSATLQSSTAQTQNSGVSRIKIAMSGTGNMNLEVRFSPYGNSPSKGAIAQWQTSDSTDAPVVLAAENFDEGVPAGYEVKNGLFGRGREDYSLRLAASQLYTFDGGSNAEYGCGEIKAMSFYYAFDKELSNIAVSLQGQELINITIKGISVPALGDNVESIAYHLPDRWYRLDLFVEKGKSADENVLYLRRNGKKILQKNISTFSFNTAFSISTTAKAFIDEISVVKYPCGMMPNETAIRFINSDYNIEKRFSGAEVFAEPGIFRDAFKEKRLWLNAESVDFRDMNGYAVKEGEEISGKYMDITGIDGNHIYLPVVAAEEKTLCTTDGKIKFTGKWQETGTWSNMGRSAVIREETGIGGKSDDACTVWYGPYAEGSDYIDYSIANPNSEYSRSILETIMHPLRISGEILVSDKASAVVSVKCNSTGDYYTMLKFEGEKILLRDGSVIGSYKNDEWSQFDIEMFPGRKYVEISVPGCSSPVRFAAFTIVPDIFNIVRFGAVSTETAESVYVALDNIYIGLAGSEAEPYKLSVLQDGYGIDQYYTAGGLKVELQSAEIPEGAALAAAVRKNGILQRCAIDDNSQDGLNLEIENITENDDEICVFVLDAMETLRPLTQVKKLKCAK